MLQVLYVRMAKSMLSQIYLKEVASFLSWNGREMTHWADMADMADIPFHLYKSKLSTFL